MSKQNLTKSLRLPVVIRRFLISWLIASTISYLVLPQTLKMLSDLNGVSQMSMISTAIMIVIFFVSITIIGLFFKDNKYERWMLLAIFFLLSALTLHSNFTWPFLFANLLVLLILLQYAFKGWESTVAKTRSTGKSTPFYRIILCILAAAFVSFVSLWTVCRVYAFCTPTYDFGIFSQMFYNMKTTGIPYTTVERDMLLSHFQVHVSPIYYLLLPIYFLLPFPATLQVLQAVVLASSIMPLWLLCRKHGITPAIGVLICAIMFLYPAYSGGTSYDIHENAFLAPLLLWLFYGIDSQSIPITILFSCLTLLVKEDAAVYVAVIALYLLVRSFLRPYEHNRQWSILVAAVLFVGSVIWFFIVTGYLSKNGDGVMTYRYQNFMVNSSGSLMDVIKTVLLCPEKVLFESVDSEKLEFIFLTLAPLLFLPLFTRKYERYILLIPYILVNLMSDYQYQHDIFFQYTFGSTACFMYLVVVNLADLRHVGKQGMIGCICLALCCVLFAQHITPVAMRYPRYVKNNSEQYQKIRKTLSLIPDDATVAATTFYTTELSQREVLYDVKYTSTDNLLSAEYIALAINSDTNYRNYEISGNDGYENLVSLLESNGYVVFAELENTLVIYKKQA